MDVSYKWIQEEYFDEPLPDPKELVERITKGAFEIEQVTEQGDDYVIDVDVLPNRAHDCLSHRGIAKEIGVLLGRKTVEKTYKPVEGDGALKDTLRVVVEDPELCPRYIGRVVQNIAVGPSPDWLKKRVESIGQRSINNIVDVTNYVLFGLGQPLHVFDADKIEGGEIRVRRARDGEVISTLDEKGIDLDESMLVIADSKDPIAIAGVKGGKKAEVDENTKNIVIEAANFNSVSVRKTAQKTQVKTDASKRYENGITSEMAEWGMDMATELILEVAGSKSSIVGPLQDAYAKKEEQQTILVSLEKVRSVLGVHIPEQEVESIFDRFGFEYVEKDDVYSVSVPIERLDLRIQEDIIEEVGRVYGYDNIPDVLPDHLDFEAPVYKLYYYQNLIRKILVERGYSEVQTYVFRPRGEVEIENPLAQDKPFVRANLNDGLQEALVSNARNVDLLGVDTVQIFEVGSVFTKGKEIVALGLGHRNPKAKKSKAKEKESLEEMLQVLSDELDEKVGGEIVDNQDGGATVQINLSDLVNKLEQPEHFGDVLETGSPSVSFAPISPYPFMTRDIAVFVPEKSNQATLEGILTEKAGDLLVRKPRLFDVFEKKNDGGTSRISYAYTLVFQSNERTLTDEEVNAIMDEIYKEIHSHEGWEVR